MTNVVPLHPNNQEPEFNTRQDSKAVRKRGKKGRFNVADINPDFIIDVSRKLNTRASGGSGGDMDKILDRINNLENRVWHLLLGGCAAFVVLGSLTIGTYIYTKSDIDKLRETTETKFEKISDKIDQKYDRLDQKIDQQTEKFDSKLDQILKNTKK